MPLRKRHRQAIGNESRFYGMINLCIFLLLPITNLSLCVFCLFVCLYFSFISHGKNFLLCFCAQPEAITVSHWRHLVAQYQSVFREGVNCMHGHYKTSGAASNTHRHTHTQDTHTHKMLLLLVFFILKNKIALKCASSNFFIYLFFLCSLAVKVNVGSPHPNPHPLTDADAF